MFTTTTTTIILSQENLPSLTFDLWETYPDEFPCGEFDLGVPVQASLNIAISLLAHT